ncbi:hypothetical protein ACG2LH_05875 [Zhouia sp. PK063]|uniref:hypothetical protein n=1 Tax=Zhouia sp. PK063 TaxID=3373602 RepID=UPI0037BB9790
MKNVVLFLLVAVTGLFSTKAAERDFGYGDSFIFNENGITFSVYPNGEFDFYIDNALSGVNANVNIGNVSLTFNSGYDYNPYVQYDDYGAVIQVENTPIYYDFYGRVSRIGTVDVYYNDNRVYRIGGLHIYYNPAGVYSYSTGFINIYNRVYVYRPWHRYFMRPAANFCLVDYRPYRRYYTPVRYTYYRPYKHNTRRTFAAVGRTYHYRENPSRKVVYVNDRRVSSRNDNKVEQSVRSRSLNTSTRRSEVPNKVTNSRNSRVANSNMVRRSSSNNSNTNSRRNSYSPKVYNNNSKNEVKRNSSTAKQRNSNAVRRSSSPRSSQQVKTNTRGNFPKVGRTSNTVRKTTTVKRSAAPNRTIQRTSSHTKSVKSLPRKTSTVRRNSNNSHQSAPKVRNITKKVSHTTRSTGGSRSRGHH